MKKVLLGTTAIVAAVAMTPADAKAEVELSGWAYQSFGLALDADENTSEDEGLVSYQNANIDFKAGTTLDNGMSVGVVVDMRAATADSTIDEMRISLSDDWGTLELGGNDSAADLVNGVYWITGNGVDSGVHSAYGSVYQGSTAFMATASSLVGDAAGIRYFSPSMNGFRALLSYQPDGDNQNSANGSNNTFANIVALGLEYSGDMNGVGVGIHGGVEHAMDTNFAAAGGDDDATKYNVGADVSVAGFMLGVNYHAHDFDTSATATSDAWSFAATAMYSTGPHTIGIEYITSEDQASVGATETEGEGYGIGYSYSLGGGVYWDARIQMFDIDSASGSTSDSEFTVFETGLGVSF